MSSTRLILSDGGFVYPDFVSSEGREELKERLETTGVTMRCSCRSDIELFYGVSKDLRIYPLKNGYVHNKRCSRAQIDDDVARSSSFVYGDEGKATVYLSFNPKQFAISKQTSNEDTDKEYQNEESDYTVELPKSKAKKKDLLPRSTLSGLVAELNHDTYSERLMNGKSGALSEEYFTRAVLAHAKTVYPNGSKRSLRALSLEDDLYCFIYGKVSSFEESAVFIMKTDDSGDSYRRFVPEQVMATAQKKFYAAYEITMEEAIDSNISVYVAGFAYKKISKENKVYIPFGRLTFFIVSQNGLYARSMLEYVTLNAVFRYARPYKATFLFPDYEGADYFGILRLQGGKEGKIYLGTIKGEIMDDEARLCVTSEPTKEDVESFIDDIALK